MQILSLIFSTQCNSRTKALCQDLFVSSQQFKSPSYDRGLRQAGKGSSECLARKVLFIHSTKPQTFLLPKATKILPAQVLFPITLTGTSTTTSSHFPSNAATPANQI